MLNENQKLAVNHINGPCLVIAGPGSGKTTVLVKRIHNLINNQINPSSILVITFTKDAALEMKQRFQRDGGDNSVNFGTFHSVFYRFLKAHNKYKNFEIITEKQKIIIIKEIIKELDINYIDEEYINGIIKSISMFYNNQNKIDYEEIPVSKDCFQKLLFNYKNKKNNNRLLDFDDMLVLTKNLLEEDKEYQRKLSQRFEYILLDEFQDINPIQYDVIKLLINIKKNKNIFAVGDDDQSIYGFRGSSPEIMLRFEDEYKDCKKIVLDCNYRSSKKIVYSSKTLIGNNINRFVKDYKAINKEDGVIKIIKVENDNEEIERILELLKEKKETAILYRNRSNAMNVISNLKSRNIDYFTDEECNIFKDIDVVRDIISFFKIVFNEYKRKDIVRIINKPEKYILKDGLKREDIKLEEYLSYYNVNSISYKNISNFIKDIKILKGMSPYLAINYILKSIGYNSYINSILDGSKEQKQDTVDMIVNIAKNYRNKRDFLLFVENECNNSQKKRKSDNEMLQLYTFHGSKGLEFERVIIIDAVEGIMPSKNAKSNDLIEEERRMFYVAMTRAKKELIIYVPNKIHNEQMYISRFVREIQCDII